MPPPSRLHRLIGVLEQMLATVRARTTVSPLLNPRGTIASYLRQRQYVEWLCDNDIHAFRDMQGCIPLDSHAVTLSNFPPSVTWGCCDQDTDTLYNGPSPVVFYIPAFVTYIVLQEEVEGVHQLVIDLCPLALRDIVALDGLVDFLNPADTRFPRRITIDTTIATDHELVLSDAAIGSRSGAVCWADVFPDDYLLVEVGVSRLFDRAGTCFIRYSMLKVARIATTPR